jgi:hypothetical protein
MPIPTVADFRITIGSNAKKKGGPKIVRVDMALERWELAKLSPAASVKIGALYNLWKECERWIKAKLDKKPTSRFMVRSNTIHGISADAWKEMFVVMPNLAKALDEYQQRKKTEGKRLALKALDHLYGYERMHYLRAPAKQGNPASMTAVIGHYYGLKKNLGKKDFAAVGLKKLADFKDHMELTYKQVETLAEVYKDQIATTAYLNKIERLAHLVAPADDGLLYDINYTLIDLTRLSGSRLELAIYAMDCYGNLFVNYEDPEKGADKFNHSSFCAGNDVVCAGLLHIGKGRLTCISNNSGHYKTTRENLHACVKILEEAGTDLSKTRVLVLKFGPTGNIIQDDNYIAATFLNDPNAKPDWPEKMPPNDIRYG